MKKIIREADAKRGLIQVTISDERWYLKSVTNPITDIPEYIGVPSVTWIAQSYPKGTAYYRWLAEHGWDEAEAIKTAAGDKGSKVHLAIEAILRGEEVRIDSQFMSKENGQLEELTLEECDCLLSFVAWHKEANPTALASEIVVFSDSHGYAGTVDFVCRIGDQFWIIDFKTSQQIWPSHELQLSAYKRAFVTGENSVDGFDPADIHLAILQVGYRKNKAGFKFTEIEDKFSLFLSAQEIWRNEHAGEAPTKKDYPVIISPKGGVVPNPKIKPSTLSDDEKEQVKALRKQATSKKTA